MSIELKEIHKSFGEVIVAKQVSLTVPTQSNVAILGTSGCGKSTLLRLIAGLETPDLGEIVIGGRVVTRGNQILVPSHKRSLSMVFQDLGLWPHLSVYQNIDFGLSGHELSDAEKESRTRDVLRACGIEELKSRQPHQLSGGQQQRVAIARAVAPKPSYLLLDEPFSGLDLVTKKKLFQWLIELSRVQGIALVLVTHDPWEADQICETMIVMERGQIVESGPTQELIQSGKSEILQIYASH